MDSDERRDEAAAREGADVEARLARIEAKLRSVDDDLHEIDRGLWFESRRLDAPIDVVAATGAQLPGGDEVPGPNGIRVRQALRRDLSDAPPLRWAIDRWAWCYVSTVVEEVELDLGYYAMAAEDQMNREGADVVTVRGLTFRRVELDGHKVEEVVAGFLDERVPLYGAPAILRHRERRHPRDPRRERAEDRRARRLGAMEEWLTARGWSVLGRQVEIVPEREEEDRQ